MGGDEKEDSNQSEQGSGFVLSCRLAYFNCGQAFTQTEDGLVCVYVGVSERRVGGRAGWGGSYNPSCHFSRPELTECGGWGGGCKFSLSQGKAD